MAEIILYLACYPPVELSITAIIMLISTNPPRQTDCQFTRKAEFFIKRSEFAIPLAKLALIYYTDALHKALIASLPHNKCFLHIDPYSIARHSVKATIKKTANSYAHNLMQKQPTAFIAQFEKAMIETTRHEIIKNYPNSLRRRQYIPNIHSNLSRALAGVHSRYLRLSIERLLNTMKQQFIEHDSIISKP